MVGIKLKRKMTEDEKIFARQIFENSLPYDDIYVSNTIGAGNRQYVTPEFKHDGGWIMHLGRAMYAGATLTSHRAIFVHELTHVWQSYHSPFRWGYVANSMCQQIVLMKGAKAYDYESGFKWSHYNAEQQAQMVMDWYIWGMWEKDERFEYIRDHIRKGKI